ncbi:MAG: hypothetical protein IPM64_13755 [Phycisphaerales bacterium]|nr:hypothetical protein [Phycisphaerales bacterium]
MTTTDFRPAQISACGGFITRGHILPTRLAGRCAALFLLTVPLSPFPAPALASSADPIPGDLNCDDVVDAHDVQAFVLASTDAQAWSAAHSRPATDRIARGDFTGDGLVNALDVPGFALTLRTALAERSSATSTEAAPGGAHGSASSTESGTEFSTSSSGPTGAGMMSSGPLLDLDIDSDNNNGDNPPDRSAAEDAAEDSGTGKYTPVNFDDDEPDGIPDRINSKPAGCDETTADDDLIPAVLEFDLAYLGADVDYRLDYDGSSLRVWHVPSTCTAWTLVEPGQPRTEWIRPLGDMNGDGHFNNFDIDALVLALVDRPAFRLAFPTVDPDHLGDFDGDWLLTNFDIDPFVDALTGTPQSLPLRFRVEAAFAAAGGQSLRAVQLDEESEELATDEVRVTLTGGHCVNWDGWQIAPDLLAIPPSLPPLSTDWATGSSPLVPAGNAAAKARTGLPQRALVAEIVDPVTGQALIQDIDLALPFGGAVFRHVRTYAHPTYVEHLIDCPLSSPAAHESSAWAAWDWNGLGWMMGEAPLLVVDYSHPEILGEAHGVWTYFAPDAHHAIPFKRHADGSYTAPAHFGALLTHNGASGVTPTQVQIELRKDVRYTFEVLPQRPVTQGSMGAAQASVGRVLQIDDRNGNRVEYQYFTPGGALNCSEVGQIDRVRLWPAGAEEPAYTLLYTYREFRQHPSAYANGEPPEGVDPVLEFDPDENQRCLFAIHVYEGDEVGGAAEDRCVPASLFCPLPDEEGHGHLDYVYLDLENIAEWLESSDAVPSGWTQRVKYHYSESSACGAGYNVGANGRMHDPAFGDSTYGAINSDSAMDLRKCTVTTRLETGPPASLDHRFTVYDYHKSASSRSAVAMAPLKAIRRHEELVNAIRWSNPGEGEDQRRLLDTADVAGSLEAATTHLTRPDFDGSNAALTIDFRAAGVPTPPIDACFATCFGRTLTSEHEYGDAIWRDGVVSDIRIRDARTGRERTYQLTHLGFGEPGWIANGTRASCERGNPEPIWSLNPMSTFLAPFRRTTGGENPTFVDLLATVGDPPVRQEIYGIVIDSYSSADGNSPVTRTFASFDAAGREVSVATQPLAPRSDPQCQGCPPGRERNAYDSLGRVIARYSPSWDSSAHSASDGLITRFEYATSDTPSPLSRLSVHRGDETGPSLTVREFSTTAPNDPFGTWLVTEMKEWPDGATGAPVITTYDYTLTQGSWGQDVISTRTARTAPVTACSGASYQHVQRDTYDAAGQVASTTVWTETTHQGNTFSSTPQTTSFFRSPTPPYNTTRIEFREGTDLAATTTFDYAGNQLVRTNLPNGRAHVVVSRVTTVPGLFGPERVREEWTYSDVLQTEIPEEPPQTVYDIPTPVTIRWYAGKQLLGERVGSVPAGSAPDGNPASLTTHMTTLYRFDELNQPLDAQVLDHTGTPTLDSGTITYDFAGMPVRSVEPDGTITRQLFDSRGRLTHTFRGTVDEAWEEGLGGDDMLLVESRVYRTAPPALYRLQEVHTYQDVWRFDDIANAIPSTTTEYVYDWREREVMQATRGAAGAPLSTHLTWFDNLDRPVLTATFDGGPPADVTLPQDLPGMDLPDVDAIIEEVYGSDSPAVSLTHTEYDERGLPHRVTDYDLTAQQPTGTVRTTLYDAARRPILEHDSAGRATTRRFNVLGHEVETRELVFSANGPCGGSFELERTHTTFDIMGNVTAVERFEAIGTPPLNTPLTAATAVRTFAHNWYDGANRLVATLDYGTSTTGGYIATTGDGPARSDESPSSAPTGARLTRYAYDAVGNQSDITHPDGSLTRHRYDSLGRLRLTIEDAALRDSSDPTPPIARRTAYRYDDASRSGLLLAMAAVLQTGVEDWTQVDWSPGPTAVNQVTSFEYHPTVWPRNQHFGQMTYSGGWNPYGDPQSPHWSSASSHKSWISRVIYPDGHTLDFTYYSDGSVASRADSRGVAMYHHYDEHGRRTDTWIDDTAYFGGLPADYNPANRVHHVRMTYLPDGRIGSVKADSYAGGSATPVATSDFGYDLRRRLATETQELHASPLGPRTIGYEWQSATSFGVIPARLAAITYPQPVVGETPATILALDYGPPGGLDDRLGRVAALTLDTGEGPRLLAAYDYAGAGRRVGTTLGNGVSQHFTLSSESGYAGLDRFGRVADLRFLTAQSTPAVIHRYSHGYDAVGNRLFSRVVHAPTPDPADPGNWIPHDNDRSQLHRYDDVARLAASHLGALSTDNQQLTNDPSVALQRSIEWRLDALGNWSADADVHGSGQPTAEGVLRADSNFGGTPTLESLTHQVDAANKLIEVRAAADGGPPLVLSLVHDRAGNLVFDGRFLYLYDGFNRLVAVHEACETGGGCLTSAHFDADGRPQEAGSPASLPIGDLVARYAYDGVGRLISREGPVAAGLGLLTSPTTPPTLAREEYYYNGVRRISTVRMLGATAAVFLAAADPVGFEGGFGDNNPADGATAERQYAWGTDYVDELVATVEHVDKPGLLVSSSLVFYLVDANYNVVASLADDPGWSSSPASATDLMLTQTAYEPYGAPAIHDDFLRLADESNEVPAGERRRAPLVDVGHQGLFFDRFVVAPGATILDPLLSPTSGSSAPERTVGLYYNRNRWYSPTLGRFTGRDPSDTALPIAIAAEYNGTALRALARRPMAAYADGPNAFLAYDSSPIQRRDAMGLSWGMEDDLDDYLADYTGGVLYTIGTLNESAKWASLGLETALGIASGLLPGSGLYDAFAAVQVLASGRGGFWDALTIAMVAFPAVKAVGNAVESLAAFRSLGRARQIASGSCRVLCLVAGTLVNTPDGEVPIEELVTGQQVMSLATAEGAIAADAAAAADSAGADDGAGTVVGADAVEGAGASAHFSRSALEAAFGPDAAIAALGLDGRADPSCDTPGRFAAPARVAALHRRLAPAVLWITIEESGPAKGDEEAGAAGPSGQNDRDGSDNRGSTPLGESVVLGVTPDHELLTADGRWQPAGLSKPGDGLTGRAGRPVFIRDIQLDSTPQVVYNLTVDGPPTYLADGVWVHNCARSGRGLWSLTEKGASRIANGPWGKLYKSKTDEELWWAVDRAGHGGSKFKVFKEEAGGLRWHADADEFGDFIKGKHKSDVGSFIPWSQIHGG